MTEREREGEEMGGGGREREREEMGGRGRRREGEREGGDGRERERGGSQDIDGGGELEGR